MIEITARTAGEPVTLTEAKTHLRVYHTADDTYITALITVARAHIEEVLTKQALWPQTARLTLDGFPDRENGEIRLARPPVVSITSVQYIDTDNVTTTIDPADYYFAGRRIIPVDGWPTDVRQTDSVIVTYLAGYTSGNIPTPIKHAILMLVSHYYEHREPVGGSMSDIPMTVDHLCRAYNGDPLGVGASG